MSDIRFAIAARRGALLLFFLLFACAGGKEVERDVRSFEPRLTTRTIWQPCRRSIPPGYVVEQADCGPANISRPAVSSASGACDTMTADHSEATRMLASQASCTDAVIARLETLGGGRAGSITRRSRRGASCRRSTGHSGAWRPATASSGWLAPRRLRH